MKFGLTQHTIDDLITIFEQHSKVDKALIFGSRAKGNYRPDSDIDIALKGQDLHTDDIIAMSVALEEKGITHKIDLINYHTIQEPDLKDHIDRVGLELYSSWLEHRFSDFVLINPTVSLKGNAEYSFVEMKDLEDGNKICSPSAKRRTSSGARFQERDTLFARITPCLENGKICQVRGLENGIGFGSTEFLVFRGKENVSDNEFVFYLSRWDEVRDFAENNFEGTSGRQRVPKNCFDNLKLRLPPLPEQTAIASILSSLDDKIDLLHRQNKTLEQLAETLFRQWFVEEAEDSWEKFTLRRFVETNQRSISKEYQFEVIEYLDTSSITNGIINETQKLFLKDAPSRAKRLVLNNDILISTVRPDQHHYGIINNPKENLVVSTGFCVITCAHISPYFIYLLLTGNDMTEYLHAIAEGSTSTYPSLKPSDIEKIEFQKPPEKKLLEFDKLASGFWNKINSNQAQIRTLNQTRDTLLPKLMSGEIRVSELNTVSTQ
ncbi:restriction endonuclease subunit S [Pinibacter aurantiacus]|uniref:Restriction endonuclease subunit S n=1 Tax=Pinibacter aurantiacus TaxID=2851599 RepID=A0A9E2W208_9BACT|nr:restriction endonuclease subunit S [Pinibacter aurantiacus]MBV4356760.1 restriction endonuclease subunit S [Pinibacter aurantiacus]